MAHSYRVGAGPGESARFGSGASLPSTTLPNGLPFTYVSAPDVPFLFQEVRLEVYE